MTRYSPDVIEKIRLSNENQFLSDARKKFGEKFDYSNVNYVRQKIPVTIICPEHGAFTQTPDKHLQSIFGCQKCGVAARSLNRLSNGQARFALTFADKFGDRLELLSPYLSVKDTIRVRCCIHAFDFETTPDRLNLYVHGCPKCANEKRNEEARLTQDEFVKLALDKFGDQFDLSKAIYSGMQTPLTISCSVHGDFVVSPVNYLSSVHGCPLCGGLYKGYTENRIQKLEKGITKPRPTTIALIKIEVFGIEVYKLGITSRSLLARYRENLREIIFETTLDELNALKLEQNLHAKYCKQSAKAPTKVI